VRSIKLGRILAAEASLQPVLAKAQDLRALAGLLDGFLPPELARQVRVVNYRDGEVVLVAASAAVAAKLRLLAPSLVIFFSKQRSQVNSVRLQVQPNASQNVDVAPQKTAYLSTPTLESLRKLYNGMRPSPARDALERLLQKRLPGKKKQDAQ
jgi:hypothetical protein